MKILQNIFAPIFIVVGLVGFSEGNILTGVLMSVFGLALLPFLFDFIEKKLKAHLKKGKVIIRFSLFFMAFYSNGNDLKNQRVEIERGIAMTVDTYHHTLEMAAHIPLDSSLVALVEIGGDLLFYDKMLDENARHLLETLGDFNSSVFLDKAVLGLDDGDFDLLEKGDFHQDFFKNDTLNDLFTRKIAQAISYEKDFKERQEYHLYRADQAASRRDWANYERHLLLAIASPGSEKVPLPYLEKLVAIKKGNTTDFVHSSLLLLEEYPENSKELLSIANTYLAQEAYRKARKYYKKYLEKDSKHIAALTNLGYCELQLKNKTRARKYLNLAMKQEGKGGRACELLSELSYKVVGYNYYSRCCDGTTSSSTGRGTCSHHGGVCRTLREPIKRRTLICN